MKQSFIQLGLCSAFFILLSLKVAAQNDTIPIPIVDSLTVVDTALVTNSDSTVIDSLTLLKKEDVKVVTTSVDTTVTKKKTKAKKPKQPFMGGIFQEPPGLEHSPKKAMLRSFMFPGLGQIYNKQYIRAPIWWGIVGGAAFYTVRGRNQYVFYRDVYRARAKGVPLDTLSTVADNVIIDVRDDFRKQMEQGFFIFLGVYLLNGIEAFTAAHLINFDISDDLSMRIKPEFDLKSGINNIGNNGAQMEIGVKISLQPRAVEYISFFE